MYFLRVFRVALSSLAANKLRSVLAVLGIVIGVSAVIMMLAMGRGAEDRVSESISNLGVNMVFVYPGQRSAGGGMARVAQAETLTTMDAEALAKLPYVVAAAPDANKTVPIKSGNVNTTVRVVGTSPEYLTIRKYAVARGNFFTKTDVLGQMRVCVLGWKIAHDLFGEGDPVGRQVQLDRKNFTVIGVMEEKGGGGWLNLDEWVYVPVTTAMTRLMNRRYLNQVILSVDRPENIETVLALAETDMLRRHKPPPGGEPDFTVSSMTEMRERMAEMTGAFTLLLSSIAIVSLLVGGIGIMNIMLVSVTERTREIGIRKAVGAKRFDILKQFLIESLTISLMGGLLGIVIGVAGARWIPRLPVWQKLASGEWKSVVSIESILLSFLFSCAVGIFFGIYPAMKAARMNPVEALRYE